MAAEPDTTELLRCASRGDRSAVDGLFARHRARLRQMVVVRMDSRIKARVDPSDVVQEALIVADKKLPAYLRDRPLPFYPWLRQIAWDRLIDAHRAHLNVHKRTVAREHAYESQLSNASVQHLAERLITSGTSPSRKLIRKELRRRMRAALEALREIDREVLILLYLEQLTIDETAASLGIRKKAVTMRHLRALKRLQGLLNNDHDEEPL